MSKIIYHAAARVVNKINRQVDVRYNLHRCRNFVEHQSICFSASNDDNGSSYSVERRYRLDLSVTSVQFTVSTNFFLSP